jgi:hypothetical protein
MRAPGRGPHGVRRAAAAALLALAALIPLTACTPGTAGPTGPGTATDSAQPDIGGEWIVTRTVTGSDDVENPAHLVGAESRRYLLVERDDCGEVLCPGSVASGESVDDRPETTLEQTADGFEYGFAGNLDCLDAETGSVVSVGGFSYTQEASLTITESSGEGAAATATRLEGTLLHTDTVTQDGLDDGCARTPLATRVEYSLTAERSP